ncbi:MAG: nitronate monooxygenase [Actinobacteria bacterium]|nr:nitronate monooxygenase [Actinomycetota bacterium]MBI3686108.1 nitronate monooxygenase [Actinomycetota bacterium]
MGVAVSSWRLASAVARTGQLGVVSGTALDVVVARRLQDGDAGGHLRRALAHFPVPEMAERVLSRYFLPDGRPDGTPYSPIPRLAVPQSRASQELAVVGNFVEVWLAKEGHDGLVGINFLEKVQMATASAAYGAVLAGVDYVLVGAGIPREVPGLLTLLARHEPARLRVDVPGTQDEFAVHLDPVDLLGTRLPELPRPQFLAIISAHVLGGYLARDEATRPDGFVIEGHRAGGHNAPPRGRVALNEDGEPIYGVRDEVSLAAMAEIGLPFWLAGTYGTPDQVQAALATGAAGVQVGTVFALCRDSGFTEDLRDELLRQLADGSLQVRTDPLASPTGFPFKVVQLTDTLADGETLGRRSRICDLGYLRTPYQRSNGALGYRCAAEPEQVYVRKGGKPEETTGRMCLCNGLTANVGLAQSRRDGYVEQRVVTLGADLDGARHLLKVFPDGWGADDAVEWLLSAVLAPEPTAETG